MKKFSFLFLFLVTSTSVFAACGLKGIQVAESRTEETLDSNNNNLRISIQAPDDWNSGKLSATVLNLDWKLSGLFATNFANKLFGSSDESIAFFAIINAPSLANAAIPLGQKLGLISFALSQFVTINQESDMRLSDGSPAHQYSISASVDQLRKLKAPMDKALDVVLITAQQHDKTYIIVYATEAGRMSQYQNAFDNILNSVTIGSASFSNMGQMTAENAIPGNDTQIFENGTSISNLAPVPMTDSPQTEDAAMGGNMTGLGNMTGDTSNLANITGPVTQDSTMMMGNMTGDTTGASGGSVTISPGSSNPSNGKFFVPDTLTASIGTTATWTNDDTTLHTVTSGSAEAGNSGTEFDSSYLAAGKTFQHPFNTAGTFDYYCTLHPWMSGKIVVS